jgi:hypothetical protein
MKVDAEEFNAISQVQFKQGQRQDMGEFYGVLERFRARMDKESGKSKTCPGGYKIPINKNCRKGTAKGETKTGETTPQALTRGQKAAATRKTKQEAAQAEFEATLTKSVAAGEERRRSERRSESAKKAAATRKAKQEASQAEFEATLTKSVAAAKKQRRSESAKKAAATRKANKQKQRGDSMPMDHLEARRFTQYLSSRLGA